MNLNKKSPNFFFTFKVKKILHSTKDHMHLLFRSAARNHLRIQKIRREKPDGFFSVFAFYSYTELKKYQKKVRLVTSLGALTGLALAGLIVWPIVFNPNESQAAVTATWNGSVSTDWATAGNWVGGVVPSTDADVVINGSYTNAPTLSLASGSVTINSLTVGSSAVSVLTVSNGSLTNKLTVTTNVTIGANGTLTHAANVSTQTNSLSLEVGGDLSIATGGKIDIAGKGFAGVKSSSGNGPGAGVGGATNGYAGGGAYGGDGGVGTYATYFPGTAYGSVTQPSDLGSAGGAGGTGTGGNGGGAVRLIVAGTLTVNGTINSNGAVGTSSNYEAGGSGGSIWITTGAMIGSGSVTANGGNSRSSAAAGGGGGGRISIAYTSSTFSGIKTAFGGASSTQYGGAGTIYTKQGSASGDIIVDNNNVANGASSTQSSGTNLTFNNITITKSGRYIIPATSTLTSTSTLTGASATGYITTNSGGTLNLPATTSTLTKLEVTNNGDIGIVKNLTLSSSNFYQNGTFSANLTDLTIGAASIFEFQNLNTSTSFSLNNLTIQNGGVVTHKANSSTQDYTLNLNVSGNLDVQAGGKIDLIGKGFAGKVAGAGYGSGAGTGGATNTGGGGGSYGGKGGNGNSTYVSGSIYGSLTNPTDLGSAGGAGNGGAGGSGGGSLRLVIGGTLSLGGSISSGGAKGLTNGYAAGGSGGSVWITAGVFAGNGNVDASGGSAYNNTYAGGGGGGRISISYTSSSFAGTYSVIGGIGKLAGEIGTISVLTPTINNVAPSTGPTVGGTTVTISGSNFYGTPTVKFGVTNATNVTLVNSNTITATSPAHLAGSVDVVVINPDSQGVTLASAFLYNELAPIVSSISPTAGSSTGGTNVIITGSNFVKTGEFPDVSAFAKVWYVSTYGNDTTGDGSEFSPYASVNKAVDMAANGDAIRILPGTYRLTPVDSVGRYTTGYAQTCFTDKSKNLTIFGSNNDTVLECYGNDNTTYRDTPLINLGSDLSVVSNLKFNYYPSKSSSYSNAIFGFTNGTFYNIFVENKSTTTDWSYSYDNNNKVFNVYNSIFQSNGRSAGDYSGAPSYTNCLFDATPSKGTRSYSLTRTITSNDWDVNNSSLPSDLLDAGNPSILDPDGTVSNIGTIGGKYFWGPNHTTTVSFGGSLATNVFVSSPTTILAKTTAHAVGTVDVSVTNYDGQAGTLTNGFTFNSPLTITGILPASALITGGDSVTITGTGFHGAPVITIGGTPATNITVVNATTITANVPAHISGAVDVVISLDDLQATLANGFTFMELAPTVSAISPTSGPASGGTAVTITGSNFIAPDANTKLLLHADKNGQNFIDSSPNIKIVTGSGDAVQVNDSSKFGGSSAYFDGSYDYLSSPNNSDFDFSSSDFTIDFWINQPMLISSQQWILDRFTYSGVSSSQYGISINNGVITLQFYNGNSTYSVIAPSAITANTWTHVAAEKSGTNGYLYINGVLVSSITNAPATLNASTLPLHIGAAAYGGSIYSYYHLKGYLDEIRISKGIVRWNNNFTVPIVPYFQSSVTLGGTAATDVVVTSPTTVNAITPMHTAGSVDVVVANYDGQNATLANGFSFNPPPSISAASISPTNNQSVNGLLISGSNFKSGATIKFKRTGQSDIICNNVVFNSSTSLSCDADFHGVQAGSWDILVTNTDGQDGTGMGKLTILGEITKIDFTTPVYTIKPNTASYAIHVQLKDSTDSATNPFSTTQINLSSTSGTGEFSLSRTSWSPITSISFDTSENTKTVYYKDSTLGTYSIGASENPSNNWMDANKNINVSEDAPYVWPFDDASDYQYDGSKISVANSDAVLSDLSSASTNPEIKNVSSASLRYSELNSFSAVYDTDNQGSVKYQLSNDDGQTWHWWNGSAWSVATLGVDQANDENTINSNISRFNADIGQIGNATLSFRAFMVSDGSQAVKLDSIFVGYKLYPYKYIITKISQPATLNESEAGAFLLQAQDQNGNVVAVDHDTVVSLRTSAVTSGSFATDLNEDISTRWDKTSITFSAGQSEGTFYYRDSKKGTPTITTVSPSGEGTLSANFSLTITSKYRFLVTGISDPIKAGIPSSVTIQAVDYLGNLMTDYTGTVYFSSSDLARSLPGSSALTAPMLGGRTFINGATFMTQGEQCVTVTDISDPNITGSQCGITVTPPPEGVAANLKIISNPQFVPIGDVSNAITVQLQDINGQPAVRAFSTTVFVYRTTTTGQFSVDGLGGWTDGSFSVVIPAGSTSANFFYKDTVVGNYSLVVSDDSSEEDDIGLVNDTQALSAVSGNPYSFSFDSSNAPIVAGTASGALSFSLRDVLNNFVTASVDQVAVISSANGAEFSLDGTTGWTTKLATKISVGDYKSSFYYRSNTAGSNTIVISDADPADGNMGLKDAAGSVNVSAAGTFRYIFLNSPANIVLGQVSPQITVQAMDVFGNVATVSNDTNVYLYSSDSNTIFSATSASFASTDHVVMLNGSSSSAFYFKQTVNTGSITLTCSDNLSSADGSVGIVDVSQTQSVSAGSVSSFVVTNPAPYSLLANQESGAINVESRNAFGAKVPMTVDANIYFHSNSTGSVKEFSLNNSPSWSNISSTLWKAGDDSMVFYYKDTKSGTKTIKVGDDQSEISDMGINNASLSVAVAAESPSKIKIISNPLNVEAGESGKVTMELEDAFGNAAIDNIDRTIDLSSNDVNGIFVDSNDNQISSVIIAAGNSTADFFYKNTTVGTKNVAISSNGLAGDSQDETIQAGIPKSARMTTGSTNLIAGGSSSAVVVMLYNAHGIETKVPNDFTVSLSSNSANGRFDQDSNGSFSSSNLDITIAAGTSSTYIFYKDTAIGDHTVYTNGTGLSQSSLAFHVELNTGTHVKFTTSSQTITAGEVSSVITAKIYDQFENEVNLPTSATVNLATESAHGEFSLTSSPWNPVTSLEAAAFQSSFSFFYKDQDVDVVNITAVSGYGSATQKESIIFGQLQHDPPTKILFQTNPQTAIINSAIKFNFYLANDANQYVAAQGQTLVNVTSDSATGLFFDEASDSWKTSLNVAIEIGETLKSLRFKDSVSGNPTITVSFAGLTSASQQETIINGSIEKIELEAQTNILTTDRIPVVVKTVTSTGMPVGVASATLINLSISGSGHFYPDSLSQNQTTAVTIAPGDSSKTVYFQQTVPGSTSIIADENPSKGWDAGTADLNITSVPTEVKITSAIQTKEAGTQSDMFTATLQDIYGNVSNASSDLNLHLSSTSQFGEFSLLSGDSWSQTDSLVMSAGTSSVSFFYSDTLAGAQAVSISDQGGTYDSSSQIYNVTTSDIYSLNFLTSQNNLEIGQTSSQIVVQAYDQYGNAKIMANNLPVYLYTGSTKGKFSLSRDFSASKLIDHLNISAGSSVATFFYQDLAPGDWQITVSDKSSLDNPDTGVLNAVQQAHVIIGDVAKIDWQSIPSEIEEGDASGEFVVKTTNAYDVEIPVLTDLPVYFSNRFSTYAAGLFAVDSQGPWSATSGTIIPAGQSRASFHYKNTESGKPLLIASDEPTPSLGFDSGLTNATSYLNVVVGAISKIKFVSAAQNIVANHSSAIYQIKTFNKSDVLTNVNKDTAIYLRSSSISGEFSSDGESWGANAVIIASGTDQATFYYRDTYSGNYTITAADTLPIAQDINWDNGTQQVNVVTQQLDHFNVRNVSDPQKQGTPSSVVVSPVDSEGYIIKEYAGTITEFKALDANGNSETAFLPDVPYTFNPSVDNGIKTFVNSVAFYSEGEKTLTVKDEGGFIGEQRDITVTSPNSNPVDRVKFIEPTSDITLAKKTSSPLITVQTQDNQGNPTNITASGGYDVRITSTSDDAEFSVDGKIWKSEEIVLKIEQNLNFTSFYYRNSKKADDELEAMDWNGEADDNAITNDKLGISVEAGEATHLVLAGNSSQIAGQSQDMTITAKDEDGDTATSYKDNKDLIIFGASQAFTEENPSCSDKFGNDVTFGDLTTLSFTDGVATCKLKLYRKENAEIKASEGAINTFGKSEWDLSVNVSAASMDRHLSVLNATPNPQKVGAPVSVSVTPKDVFGNLVKVGGENVVFNVTGSNTVSDQVLTFDPKTETYQGIYTPKTGGTDTISSILSGEAILQDGDAESDGIFHETVEDSSIVVPEQCNYLTLNDDSSEIDKLAFDACVKAGNTVKSNELSKSSTRGTSVSQLELEAKSSIGKNLSGLVSVRGYLEMPSGMKLSSQYLKTENYLPYLFLKMQTDAESDSISKTRLKVIVSKKWMEYNKIDQMVALSLSDDKENVLDISKQDSSSDNVTFKISADEFPEYLTLLGKKSSSTINDKDGDDKKKEKIDTGTGHEVIDSEKNKDKKTEQDKKTAVVLSKIEKIFNVDSTKANEIAKIISLVSAGTAAAAAFPTLSYMLGSLRSMTAVSYRRKQKWGVVYDSETGEAISNALVIISDDEGKVKEMKNTDRGGFYSFLAPKGVYVMEVRKSGYKQVEKAHIVSFKTYYDNSYIPGDKIVLEEEDVISLNIPMTREQETLMQKIFNPATITHAIFWSGFSFSVFAAVVSPTRFNIAIVIFFVVNFLVNTFYKKTLKTGKILSKELKAVPFATVKVFDKENNELVARTIANEKGVYIMILNEGEYMVEVQSAASKITKEVSLATHGELKEQIVLE